MTKPRPVILYRPDPALDEEEMAAMRQHFPVVKSRLDVVRHDLVVGRLSVLPFYADLEADLHRLGAGLINTYRQHRYIADLGAWVTDLEEVTPPTFTIDQMPYLTDDDQYDGFVLKGETNSRKFLWDTHMWAPTKADVVHVYTNLVNDGLISNQAIYIRRKARLRTFFTATHGLPITNEYRVFVARGEILSCGFYWSSYADQVSVTDRVEPPVGWLRNVIALIGDRATAYALDVALHQDGVTWMVVELNDLQMAGRSENDPAVLYKRLADVLR
jgi:hypothetical protein